MKADFNFKDPRMVALLAAELIRVFPDVAPHMRQTPDIIPAGAIWFALSQEAWIDINWGWQNEAPSAKVFSDWETRPCTYGGRFIRTVRSIGD